MRLFIVTLLLAVSGVSSAGTESSVSALVQELRLGGYIIYFRHAKTEWSQSDKVVKEGDWVSCDPSQMRQLSDEGRQTARETGDTIRALEIPIGRVLSSPYCRAVETVNLMDIGSVEITTQVMNLRTANYVGGREVVIHRARMLLGTPPPQGTNTVIGAHGNVARAATSVYPGEGEGLVFRPHGNGEFTFIGRLTPLQWQTLSFGTSE